MRILAALMIVGVALSGCADGPDAPPLGVAEPTIESLPVSLKHTVWGPTYMFASGQGAEAIVIPEDRTALGFNLTLDGPADIPVSWTVSCVGCGSQTVEGLMPLHLEWTDDFPPMAQFRSKMHRTDRTALDDTAMLMVEGFKSAFVDGIVMVQNSTLVPAIVEEALAVEGTVGCVLYVDDPCYGSAVALTRPFTIEAKAGGTVQGLRFNVTWDATAIGSEELVVEIDCLPQFCTESWHGPYELGGTSPIVVDIPDIGLRAEVDVEVRVQFPGQPGLLERIHPGRQDFHVDGLVIHEVMVAA